MALIKDIEEFREFVPVNTTLLYPKLQPSIMDVQRDILETYCGAELIRSLDLSYKTKTFSAMTDKEKTLLDYIRPALAPIAMCRYIPIGEVQIDAGGISAIGETDTKKGADNQQIIRLRSSMLSIGMNAFERLLSFLAQNVEDYPHHQVILDNRPKSLLPDAAEFSKAYQIFKSHLTYQGLISILTRIEEDVILPALGDELYNEIYANSSLSLAKGAIRRKAQRALAYLVVSDAIEVNMAIDLSVDGLRLNYSSEFGNLPYYKPPGDRAREAVLAAIKRKSDGMLEQLQNAVGELNGGSAGGMGLPDNEGSKIIMFS